MENRMKNTFVLLSLVVFALVPGNRADVLVPVSASQPVTSSSPVTEIKLPQHPVEPVKAAVIDAATAAASDATNVTTKPVQLEVFYEALCTDSVNFVEKQLSPVYDKLNQFLNVTFIPFSQGNITKDKDGNDSLVCRRPNECDADRVHACGIEYIKETDKLLKFVNCSLVEGFKTQHVPIEKCTIFSQLDTNIITSINTCIQNTASSNLLLENFMQLSRANNVKSVPKIVFNKQYSDDTNKLALTNLMQAVCTLIPPTDSPAECKNIVSGSSAVVVGILPLLISVYYFIRMF